VPKAEATTFARRLRSLREAAGLSRYQLAALCGLGYQRLYRFEKEGVEPDWSAVQALADALGISTEALRTTAG
jgi:transcriptional regulator with XRE-family HTH domain